MPKTLFDSQGNVQIVSSTDGYDMGVWTNAGDTPQAVLDNPSGYVWSTQFNAFVAAAASPVVLPDWARPINVDFYSNAGANLTLTNLASAAGFLGGSNRNVKKMDLDRFTRARLTARVMTAGTASSKLNALYSSSFQTAIGSYSNLGVSSIEVGLSSTGISDSGWIDLANKAKAVDRFIAIGQLGGDGVADPALGDVILWFQ